jgi:hypothetical protein
LGISDRGCAQCGTAGPFVGKVEAEVAARVIQNAFERRSKQLNLTSLGASLEHVAYRLRLASTLVDVLRVATAPHQPSDCVDRHGP